MQNMQLFRINIVSTSVRLIYYCDLVGEMLCLVTMSPRQLSASVLGNETSYVAYTANFDNDRPHVPNNVHVHGPLCMRLRVCLYVFDVLEITVTTTVCGTVPWCWSCSERHHLLIPINDNHFTDAIWDVSVDWNGWNISNYRQKTNDHLVGIAKTWVCWFEMWNNTSYYL